MSKLSTFNIVTLNGYYKGRGNDITWMKHDTEENEHALEMLKSGNTLVFGRVTYESMANYWTTLDALRNTPIIAERMNMADKIVFSRTLKKAEWYNSRLMSGNIIEEMRQMKQIPGKDMTILGSGSIITQFAEHGLIDEYQIMVDPVAIGEGTSLFKGIVDKLELQLVKTKIFKNGVILLYYQPIQ